MDENEDGIWMNNQKILVSSGCMCLLFFFPSSLCDVVEVVK
jgi:hypothetical protein